ncbi:MAG: phosphodiester glycosidase family protein [Chloroflexi bacterium]|nr:phosphodiester glycosidase family protein [Chloroflexota bacterium]
MKQAQIKTRTTLWKSRSKPKRLIGPIIGIWILTCILAAVLVIIPAASPATGAQVADLLRTVVGPQPVAVLESLSFKMQDKLHQYLFIASGQRPQISLANTTSVGLVRPTGTTVLALNPHIIQPAIVQMTTALPPTATPIPPSNVVGALPQIGWQAYGPTVNGAPLMAQAMIMLNPGQSYAGTALVRIDLSQLQLHVMVGTLEPAHPSGIGNAISNLGMIPPQDYNNLIAAFNGGFKGVHGQFGMMLNGITLLQPIDGMATIAMYQDGSVRIGAWGSDILPSPDMVAFRQNCPPLIEAGQFNPALFYNDRRAWGYSQNNDVTWRTGVGISQDGRYLIYAVSNGTTVQDLANALQMAGAYNAMQLDINEFYAHFVTYQPDTSQSSGLTAERLLSQMTDTPSLYLTPSLRDFFYLTLRQ